MHDLLATNHISQMVLLIPDAFCQYGVNFFLKILRKLKGIQLQQKMNKIRHVISEIR